MDLFDLAAKITIDTSGYERGLSNASSKLSWFGSKLKAGFGFAAKIGGAALGAAATGVSALTKKVIDSYGEYEQLVGGINKLFGDGADALLRYSEIAYQTAGMSANEYMQNVTGFSAALINSLKGDTEQAAEIANMAMQDISDNANTFGKYSAQELANVYQALAKGTYTTLDNLNLGFGGTKEGMQALIKKANELRKAQGLNADLTIKSYADIVQAIHEVQAEMNITGTTQREAATTIQGSLGMLKGAWKNLVTGLGNENANLDQLFDNVVKSAESAFWNIVPVAERALKGLGALVVGISPMISEKLPGLLKDLLPQVVDVATQLFSAVLVALPDLVEILIAQLPGVLSKIWGALKQVWSNLTPRFSELWGRVTEAFDASAAGKAFDKLKQTAQNALNAIKTAWGKVKSFFSGLWDGIVSEVSPMIDSVVSAFQSGWELIQTIWNLPAVQAVWALIVASALKAWETIKTAWSIAAEFFSMTWENIKNIAAIVWESVKGVATIAWEGIKAVWNGAKAFFTAVFDIIAGIFSATSAVLSGDFEAAWEAIKGIANTWQAFFQTIWEGVVSVFSTASSVGANIVNQLLAGVQSAWDGLVSWITGAWEKIKSIFTVDVQLGGSVSGTRHAIGSDYVPYNNYPAILHKGEAVLTAREADEWRRGQSGGNTFNFTVNVDGAKVQDDEALAQKIAYEMKNIFDREVSAYA